MAYCSVSLALRPFARLSCSSRHHCGASADVWILACFAAFALVSKLAMLEAWDYSMGMELSYNSCSEVGSVVTSATSRRYGKRSFFKLILSVLLGCGSRCARAKQMRAHGLQPKTLWVVKGNALPSTLLRNLTLAMYAHVCMDVCVGRI